MLRRRPLVPSVVSVFLAALLASHPAAAEENAPATGNPPAYSPEHDPWLNPSRPRPAPAPSTDPSAPAAYPPGSAQVQPVYPLFVPNPSTIGSMAATNPYSMGGVFVELKTSSNPVRIERVVAPGIRVPVCVSPCRQVLPRNSVYVITGEGVRPTTQFVLPDDRNQVVLDVNPGSSGQVVSGAVLMGAGLLAAYVGFILIVASAMPTTDNGSFSQSRESNEDKRTTGQFMMGGGILAGLIGLYLILDSRTVVTSSTGSRFTETPSRQRGRLAFTPRGIEF